MISECKRWLNDRLVFWPNIKSSVNEWTLLWLPKLAASSNCVKLTTANSSLSVSTYLLLDSLVLGSQGVLHFIRTEDHFPIKCANAWMRLLVFFFFFLVLSKLANKRQQRGRRCLRVSGSVGSWRLGRLRGRGGRKAYRSRADSSSNSVSNQKTGGGAGS